MSAWPAYDRRVASFRWDIPARFNLGVAICDIWAARDPDRVALLDVRGEAVTPVTYGTLAALSNRFADALGRTGIGTGERVAVLLPQRPEVVVAHAGIAKRGAVAVPLAAVFGPDALAYRLGHSGARAIVLDAQGFLRLAPLLADLPNLDLIVCADGPAGPAIGWDAFLAGGRADEPAAETGPDDPAMMIYTSGTTGQPKGALHGHRVLAGHGPGFEFGYGPAEPGDVMWTPADWAWAGGLFNALMPSLARGMPVVAWAPERFEPEAALALMRRLAVTTAFLPPTALRLLRAADGARFDGLSLRAVLSAGETLGAEVQEWAVRALDAPINELYGQTECNLVLGSSAALGVSRPGALGLPVPGHAVALLGPDGEPVPPGETGEIAIRRPDPVMFLGYWRDEEATAAKFSGDWMTTGDRAIVEPDGLWRFLGRSDDLITSAGYRIGPGEIEDCLLRHPAVAMAAVVGKADALRTEIVKAFVVLRPGAAPSDALTMELGRFVRERLSAHEYPREIAYVDALPMTASGKIIRRMLRERG